MSLASNTIRTTTAESASEGPKQGEKKPSPHQKTKRHAHHRRVTSHSPLSTSSSASSSTSRTHRTNNSSAGSRRSPPSTHSSESDDSGVYSSYSTYSTYSSSSGTFSCSTCSCTRSSSTGTYSSGFSGRHRHRRRRRPSDRQRRRPRRDQRRREDESRRHHDRDHRPGRDRDDNQEDTRRRSASRRRSGAVDDNSVSLTANSTPRLSVTTSPPLSLASLPVTAASYERLVRNENELRRMEYVVRSDRDALARQLGLSYYALPSPLINNSSGPETRVMPHLPPPAPQSQLPPPPPPQQQQPQLGEMSICSDHHHPQLSAVLPTNTYHMNSMSSMHEINMNCQPQQMVNNNNNNNSTSIGSLHRGSGFNEVRDGIPIIVVGGGGGGSSSNEDGRRSNAGTGGGRSPSVVSPLVTAVGPSPGVAAAAQPQHQVSTPPLPPPHDQEDEDGGDREGGLLGALTSLGGSSSMQQQQPQPSTPYLLSPPTTATTIPSTSAVGPPPPPPPPPTMVTAEPPSTPPLLPGMSSSFTGSNSGPAAAGALLPPSLDDGTPAAGGDTADREGATTAVTPVNSVTGRIPMPPGDSIESPQAPATSVVGGTVTVTPPPQPITIDLQSLGGGRAGVSRGAASYGGSPMEAMPPTQVSGPHFRVPYVLVASSTVSSSTTTPGSRPPPAGGTAYPRVTEVLPSTTPDATPAAALGVFPTTTTNNNNNNNNNNNSTARSNPAAMVQNVESPHPVTGPDAVVSPDSAQQVPSAFVFPGSGDGNAGGEVPGGLPVSNLARNRSSISSITGHPSPPSQQPWSAAMNYWPSSSAAQHPASNAMLAGNRTASEHSYARSQSATTANAVASAASAPLTAKQFQHLICTVYNPVDSAPDTMESTGEGAGGLSGMHRVSASPDVSLPPSLAHDPNAPHGVVQDYAAGQHGTDTTGYPAGESSVAHDHTGRFQNGTTIPPSNPLNAGQQEASAHPAGLLQAVEVGERVGGPSAVSHEPLEEPPDMNAFHHNNDNSGLNFPDLPHDVGLLRAEEQAEQKVAEGGGCCCDCCYEANMMDRVCRWLSGFFCCCCTETPVLVPDEGRTEPYATTARDI